MTSWQPGSPCYRSTGPGNHVDLSREGVSDDMLLAGFAASDPRLSMAFVRRFQRVVFGIAVGVVGDTGMAEHISQQAFKRARWCADAYDPRRSGVRTWLIRLTHNLAVDAVRIRRVAPAESAEMHRLHGSLAGLPAEQARAVVMAVVHGMTVGEIADIEEIPLGTAKSRIRAGMSKVHSALPAQCEDYE